MRPTGVKIVLGTVGPVAITFPLAVVWNLLLFPDTYKRLSDFGRFPLFGKRFFVMLGK